MRRGRALGVAFSNIEDGELLDIDKLRIDGAWDDLRFPAQGINPAGSAAPATIDNGTDYPGTLLFASNTDNHVAGIAQLPHQWKEGSELRPHIHWAKTTSDAGGAAVSWQLRYRLWPIGSTPLDWVEWISGTIFPPGNLTTAEHHNITNFGSISMTGQKVSTCLLWELRRNTALDSYGSNARLIEFDIHYQNDSLGSQQEFIKD